MAVPPVWKYQIVLDPSPRGDWSAYEGLNPTRLSRFATREEAKQFCEGLSPDQEIKWRDGEYGSFGKAQPKPTPAPV